MALTVVILAGAVTPSYALRILPAGDSITFGLTSTNDLGYRQTLHDLIVAESPTLPLEFIGTQNNGPLKSEGYPGNEADPFIPDGMGGFMSVETTDSNPDPGENDNLKFELEAAIPTLVAEQGLGPDEDIADVVLLHIGTNTIPTQYLPPGFGNASPYAFAQFERLLEAMLTNPRLDEATIIVAQIIPDLTGSSLNGRENNAGKVDNYNGRIADLFAELDDGDQNDPFDPYADRLRLVDMFNIPGVVWATDDDMDGDIDTPNPAFLPDAVHPSDAGYAAMGQVWFDDLLAGGFLDAPPVPGDTDGDGDVDLDDFNTLAANFGLTATPGGATIGDFDDDMDVDLNDFNLLAANFGIGTSEAVGSLPEPGTVGLLLCGLGVGLRRRRG